MPTLKEFASSYASKKEITDLESIPINTEVKTGTFDGKGENEGKKMPFNYIEIDGWKYTLRGALVDQIKAVIANKPTCTKIKIGKTPKGELFVMPID
jgi:hypothetical protein